VDQNQTSVGQRLFCGLLRVQRRDARAALQLPLPFRSSRSVSAAAPAPTCSVAPPCSRPPHLAQRPATPR
jgi:hypothetical protein